jgi:Sulfatase
MRWKLLPAAIVALTIVQCASMAIAQQQKPNILVIMGDDIGYWNIRAYNRGQMGYRTPNIDRIANEGAILTDYYGQQSCTAGARSWGQPAIGKIVRNARHVPYPDLPAAFPALAQRGLSIRRWMADHAAE